MNMTATGCHVHSAPTPGPTQQPVGTSDGPPQVRQLTGQGHKPNHQ